MNDLRFALRQLWKRPGFTSVVVLILALGIGANTLIFSVVNALLIRPLPFASPEQLVVVREANLAGGIPDFSASAPNFRDWQQQSHSFQEIGALWDGCQAHLAGDDQPFPVSVARVTSGFFTCLRIQPALGRTFQAGDEEPGRHRVILLSHALWGKQFGGSDTVVGDSILLDGVTFTIVGVLPPGLEMLEKRADAFIPNPRTAFSSDRGDHMLRVFARLKENVPLASAEAEMRAIARRLELAFPQTNAGWSVSLVPLHRFLSESLRSPLLLLWGAVGGILLIACANVANLLLARASRRTHEIAIRVALGATRRRVIRQMLTESLLLAVLGGVSGMFIALWGTELISRGRLPLTTALLQGTSHQLWQGVQIDGKVLAFTGALAVLTGIAFGLVPAVKTSRLDFNAALKEGGRTTFSGSGRHRHLHPLVVAEVALAMMLLVGAGLLIRNLLHLQNVDPGFDADRVASLTMSLPQSKFAKPDQRIAFFAAVQARIRALPTVENVALAEYPPMEQWGHILSFSRQPLPPLTLGEHSAQYRRISADYFRTLHIPLLQGRFFSAADRRESSPVVVINATMARRFWPQQSAVGKVIYPYGDTVTAFSVVGVVGDEKIHGLGIDPEPVIYFTYRQSPWPRQMSLLVRTRANPWTLIQQIQKSIRAADLGVALTQSRLLQDLVAQSIDRQRISTRFITGFALLALALAALGIYGVMTYAVGQRTHEIGIRLALGARPRDVVRMVIGQGMKLAVVGLLLGWIGALALGRFLANLLYEVRATDPVVLGVTPFCLAAVALLACALPAIRAARIHPALALRNE